MLEDLFFASFELSCRNIRYTCIINVFDLAKKYIVPGESKIDYLNSLPQF